QGKISSDGCLKKEQMVVSAIASTPHCACHQSPDNHHSGNHAGTNFSDQQATFFHGCTQTFLFVFLHAIDHLVSPDQFPILFSF
ncbi:hypothetical protein ACVJNP_004754, partial [Escherichia coli]